MLFLDKDNEEELIVQENFFEAILSFYSNTEKDEFTKYVLENKKEFEREFCCWQNEHSHLKDKYVYKKQLITGKVLKKMLNIFRQANN